MLILVGVTINFALNGGIINKAKQASNQMQIAADREELQMAVISAMDYTTGEVDFSELQTYLPNWSISGNTCTSPSGNVFTVASDGTITLVGEGSGSGSESYSGSDSGSYYSSDSDSDSDSSDDSSSAPELNSENLAKYVEFEGILWRVLYDDETNGLQLISANTLELGNVCLGYNDNMVDWTDGTVIASANIFSAQDGESDSLTNVEKAIYSYNHLVENLNAKCKEVVNSNDNRILKIRCVGSNPLSRNSENSVLYTSTFLQNNPSSGTYSAGSFNGIGKSTDTNYETDYNQMYSLGLLVPDNSEEKYSDYWLASRFVEEYSSGVNFSAHCVNNGGGMNYNYLWCVDSGDAYGSNIYYGVRPVVSLTSTVLSTATGSGTTLDPFVIQ